MATLQANKKTNPDINLLCEGWKPALLFIAIVATVAIVFSACKKINESTEPGGDLIPPVANINAFGTILTIQTAVQPVPSTRVALVWCL